MTIRSVLSTTSDIPGSSAGLVDRNATEKDILILRGLEAGPGIQIDVVDFDLGVYTTPQKKIVIQAKGAGGGAIGEINRASNLGFGVGLFADKSGDALRFKSLVAGSGIRLTPSGQEITVESDGVIGATNLGSGSKLYDDTQVSSTLGFRTLVPGANITLAEVGNTIQIGTTARNNEGTNLGGIGSTALYAGLDNASRLTFRGLQPGRNIELVQDLGEIWIHATDTGEVATASNRAKDDPANYGVFADKINLDFQFRSLRAGSNVTLSSDASAITIAAKGSLIDGTNRGTAGGGKVDILAGKIDDVLQFRRLVAGTSNVSLQQNADEVTVSVIESGQINTGNNLGSGDSGEAVYVETPGPTLNFKRIKEGDNVQITSDADSIIISATDTQGIWSIVEDLTPQLGGDLDVQDHAITSTANRNVVISANGTGQVVLNGGVIVLNGLRWPIIDGSDGQVLTNNGAGSLSWTTVSSGGPGEVTTASNIGSDGVGVFHKILGTDLHFKRLYGPGVVTVTDNTAENRIDLGINIDALEDALTLGDIDGVLPVGKGGTGATDAAAARVSLGIKTMAAQDYNDVGITGGSIDGVIIGGDTPAEVTATSLTASGTVTLNSSAWPTSRGMSGQVLTTNGAGSLSWATVSGGGGSGGEANDGANFGTAGIGFYKNKLGATLQFLRLNPASPKITVSLDGATEEASTGVRIDVAEDKLNIANMIGILPVDRGGTGRDSALTQNAVLIGGSSGIEQTLVPNGINTVLTWTGSTFAWTSPSGSGGVSTGSNVGTGGVAVYKGKTGTTLEFKSVSAALGNRVSVASNGNDTEVVLDVVESNLSLDSIGAAGSKLSVAKGGTGAATFPNNGLLVGRGTDPVTSLIVPTVTNTVLRWNGNGYEWGSVSPGGEVNTASNATPSTGIGIWKTKSGVDLVFRSINAASTKMTAVLNANGNQIDLDVAESVLNIGNMTGDLPVGRGGTGQKTYQSGDILYATGPTTLDRKAKGGNSTVLKVNAAGVLDYAKVDLTADVTGVLPIANGGIPAPPSNTSGQVLTYNGSSIVWLPPTGGSGSGAPVDAQYLVLASDNTLTSERVLTLGTGLSRTDVNGVYTLSVADNTTTQKIEVVTNGETTVVGPHKRLNFVGAGGVTVAAAASGSNTDQIDVTITGNAGTGQSGGGGGFSGPFTVTFTINGFGNINTVTSFPAGWSVTGNGSNQTLSITHNTSFEPRHIVWRSSQATGFKVTPLANASQFITMPTATLTSTVNSTFTVSGVNAANCGGINNGTVQAIIYFA